MSHKYLGKAKGPWGAFILLCTFLGYADVHSYLVFIIRLCEYCVYKSGTGAQLFYTLSHWCFGSLEMGMNIDLKFLEDWFGGQPERERNTGPETQGALF
jgi:hypothetical protein